MAKSQRSQLKGKVAVINQHLPGVTRFMTRPHHFLPEVKMMALLWLALACLMLLPTPLFASSASITLDRVHPTNIIVKSQNNAYTGVVNGSDLNMWVNIHVVPTSGARSRIRQLDSKYTIQSSYSDRAENSSTNTIIPYTSDGVDSYHNRVQLFQSRAVIERFVLDECDKNKAIMLSDGNPENDIFARDRTLPVTIILNGWWQDDRQRHQIPEYRVLAAFQITCARNSNRAAGPDDSPFRVKKATIQTSNITRAGICAVALQVSVTTNRPNAPVRFNLHSSLPTNPEGYRLMTDRYGNAIGNYKLRVASKGRLETGTIHLRGSTPGSFLSNVENYSITCPIGHGLTKVPRAVPPRGIPKSGKIKAPSIRPLSGATKIKKPQAPSITPPPAIPTNKLPIKKLPTHEQ